MVDIHAHVLPGLDDGAADLDTAVAMCKIAADAGTRELVATPHCNLKYGFDSEAVDRKLEQLQAKLGDTIHLHRGSDLNLNWDTLTQVLEDPQPYTINGRQYLLVEFAEDVLLGRTSRLFEEFRSAGVTPIITHPERNAQLRKDIRRMLHWVERGCLVQVTAGSLLGLFGETSQAAAIQLMDGQLVHFLASDGHNTTSRPPLLDEAYEMVEYRWGPETAERLLIDNPWATLWGHEIEAPRPRLRRSAKTLDLGVIAESLGLTRRRSRRRRRRSR